MKKIIILISFFLVLSSCNSIFENFYSYYIEHAKFYLYYKITGVKFEILTFDSINNDKFKLNNSNMINNNGFYIRVVLLRQGDVKTEATTKPGAVYSKCSKEKITNFDFKITKPNGEVESLNKNIIQQDTTKINNPHYYINIKNNHFKDLNDLIEKLNNCDIQVENTGIWNWSEGVLFFCNVSPVNQNGKYIISSEIKFSDNRMIKEKVKVKGKLD